MKKQMILLAINIIFSMIATTHASSNTVRITEFSNDKVNVWRTTILPGTSQILKMHRHDYNRVLVAFDDGVLKIKNNKGDIHYLNLVKNKAYYLKKDLLDEIHSDENVTDHSISVLVTELKY